ncbi:glycosyltransferase family 2 protein [Sphingopyxis macrogoltabida]|uniref:Glycosyltransferase 2-like domain-containing protein n=1 Tax=Sphingopyxis macrogoltabida TaxID=33050 RepID=A0AAC9AXN9_SPHMC|nr:glycosyltransferase family 2 protein [Sphingopyxis macrogoltabida]ALJ15649.1 hypothetical protein LH19_22475 [Sphingopyxis macrogoltabida]AMU91887.1 hypothetical protein ATM17_23020 [Sphingopyxis macrogoltabida]
MIRDMSPLLSICIPTFNRRDKIARLVAEMLRTPGPFEICVHVDGSTDGSFETLRQSDDPRLRVTYSENAGRARSLMIAMEAATGKFIMPFDDDDWLYAAGLQNILDDCASPLPPTATGYIYHLDDEDGNRVGTAFPDGRNNFLSLRCDHDVRGDKKEVVLTGDLRAVAYPSNTPHRRIPTSYLWSRLALTKDVVARNISVGRKHYLPGGMSENIASLKIKNASPMAELQKVHIQGYFKKRYRSKTHFVRCVTLYFSYIIASFLNRK